MAAIFGPGGPIILPRTVRGGPLFRGDCPRHDRLRSLECNEYKMTAFMQRVVGGEDGFEGKPIVERTVLMEGSFREDSFNGGEF